MSVQTFKISRSYPAHQYQNWITQTEELIDTVPLSDDILFWGAKGNGTTDDTVAIQTALDSGIRCLFFPAGTYLITATLTINTPNSIRIEGCQTSRTIITGAVSPLLIVDVPYVFLEDLTFTSTATNAAGSSAIKLKNMFNSAWKNIFISATTESGLLFEPGQDEAAAYNSFNNLIIYKTDNTATNYNIKFTIEAGSNGFANENCFFGGRLVASATMTPYQIWMQYGNYNRFFGTCMESNNNSLNYAAFLDILTVGCYFTNCRVERTKGIRIFGIEHNVVNGYFSSVDLLKTYNVTDSSTFAVGDVITGVTSATIATVYDKPTATSMRIYNSSGSYSGFTYGETITGVPSGGSTTILYLGSIPNGYYQGSLNQVTSQDLARWSNSQGQYQRTLNYHVQAGLADSNSVGWNTVMHNSYYASGFSNVLRLTGSRATGFFIQADRAGTSIYTVDATGIVNTTGDYRVDGTQVVSNRVAGFNTTVVGAAAATAINATTITATDPNIQALAAMCNAMKSAMITHGLIGA